MSTDYRALCAELAEEVEHLWSIVRDDNNEPHPLADRARAALAQQHVSQPYKLPDPVAPTDEELLASVRHFYGDQTAADMGAEDDLCTARAVLARYGTAAIQPVQVSERLPEAGDWVWHCYAGVRFWIHGRYNGRQFFIGDGPKSQPATHWLPANALPTPRLSRD